MVTFSPLNRNDYDMRATRVQGALSSGGVASTDDLMGHDIFGAFGYKDGDDRSLAQYHRRGFIELMDGPQSPILNFAVAGRTGENLKLVLGLGSTMESILKFRVFMQNGAYVHVSELPDTIDLRNYLMGPQILYELIENFDIHANLMQAIRIFLLSFNKNISWGVVNYPTPYPVIGEYFAVVEDGDNWSIAQAYMEWLTSKGCHSSGFKRLSYLYALDNLPDGKDRLRSCILTRIMVTPVNTRPSMDANRFDPLTKAYKELYLARAHVVQTFIGTPAKATAIQAYKSLMDKATFLLIEHDQYNQQDKSILERLKGKTGLIRDKMLGKRVDFSGRSVITINPFMSIRDIGIPKDMLPKLYRSSIMRSNKGSKDPSSYLPRGGKDTADACLRTINSEHLLEDVKVITGRQPTLHKPSMRAFNPVPVDSRSIQLNPLCVIGFNADFDGDQMYVRVPTTEEGKAEANELLSMDQNMYLPKSGECVVMPRQEIIYGLNVCTRDVPSQGNGGAFKDFNALVDAIKYQRVHIYDKVSCRGQSGNAGRVAFLLCVERGVFSPQDYSTKVLDVEVTSKSIRYIVNTMVQRLGKDAIPYIDNMVLLGFTVAGTYPPALNLLTNTELDYSGQIAEFNQAIAEDKEAYEMGWESEAEYQEAYTAQYSDKVTGRINIENDVDPENGFIRLAKSGARGSMSLVQQLYGYKGLVQDGSTGGYFRAVIEHSYANQLTPLEHFVTAYGGRAGLITKSLSTADSGYASRKIWHATSPFMITNDDCGTTEGITISVADIIENTGVSFQTAQEIFVDIVTGRFLAVPHFHYDKEGNKIEDEKAGVQISADMARRWAQQDRAGAIIRSILKCKNPCCKMCYGTDLSNNRRAAIGLPIGFIAAQSIGEPGTQLNMDAFKKGGVAEGKVSRLAGFNKLNWYISCKKGFNALESYDPIAWADGEVTVTPKTNGTKAIRISGSRHAVSVPVSIPIRTGEVKRGEALRVTIGDRSVNELAEYAGIEVAQKYLCYALYDVYRDTDKVNFKHFEVLAMAMTMYRVYTTDRDDLVPGQLHDALMMYNGSLTNTVYSAEIIDVANVQCSRPYALSKVIMENVRSGLADIVLLGLTDPLTYPLNRIMMGMKPYADRRPDSPYHKTTTTNSFMNQRRV